MAVPPSRILVLHGPNLNRLGLREPDVYGRETLAELDAELVSLGHKLGSDVTCRQSNHEGDLVDWIHETPCDAIIINAGAYTHTSIAIRDALLSVDVPAFEVHITNVHRREAFRHASTCADVVVGRIMGFGTRSYTLALRGAVDYLAGRAAQLSASGD